MSLNVLSEELRNLVSAGGMHRIGQPHLSMKERDRIGKSFQGPRFHRGSLPGVRRWTHWHQSQTAILYYLETAVFSDVIKHVGANLEPSAMILIRQLYAIHHDIRRSCISKACQQSHDQLSPQPSLPTSYNIASSPSRNSAL